MFHAEALRRSAKAQREFVLPQATLKNSSLHKVVS
jgi:hypothetical protein